MKPKMIYEVEAGVLDKREVVLRTANASEAYAKFRALKEDPRGPDDVKIGMSLA